MPKEKSKKSSKGEKAHKSSKSSKHGHSESESAPAPAPAAPVAAAPAPPAPAPAPSKGGVNTSLEFEAGLLFSRYDGRLGKAEFADLVREIRSGEPQRTGPAAHAGPGGAGGWHQPLCEACAMRVPCRVYCYQCSRSVCPDCDAAVHASAGWQSHRRVVEPNNAAGGGNPYATAGASFQTAAVRGPRPAGVVSAPASVSLNGYGGAPRPTGSLAAAHTSMLGLGGRPRGGGMGPYATPSHPPPPLQHCQLHPGMELDFFCDSCGLAICSACCSHGAHVGQGHLVRPLREVYGQCLAELQNRVSASIFPKREEVLMHIQRTASAMEQVRAAKLRVERETLEDQRHILQALGAAEATKLSTLQRDLDQLQADLNAVDHCIQQLPPTVAAHPNALTGLAAGGLGGHGPGMGMVELVQFFPDLCGILERIGQQPVHLPATVDLDFTRVTAERAEAARQLEESERQQEAAAQLLATKDDLIWTLLEERREAVEAQTKLKQEVRRLSDDSAAEIEEWAALTDDLSRRLDSLKMRCRECGAQLAAGSVNGSCPSGQRHVFA